MQICKAEKCTGCFACISICPVQCIEMEDRKIGHIYPFVDLTKCIGCELCKKVCPENRELELNMSIKAYAAWSINDVDRTTSTSGGVASVFYSTILENGGVAIGAKYADDFRVQYDLSSDRSDLFKFKGSKYIHSLVNDTFIKTKALLDSKKNVVFIGLPCQVSGLKSYLRIDYDNLTLVDLVCHGVPSNILFKQHLLSLQKSLNKKPDKISFRDNNELILKLEINKEEYYKAGIDKDFYYLGFIKGLFYRDSCYSCRYARNERISDITIGDFWGLDESQKEKYQHEKGVSLILANTDKGLGFVNECKNRLNLNEEKVAIACKSNSQLNSPSKRHKKHELFVRLYEKKGYIKAVKRCLYIDILKYKVIVNMQKRGISLNWLTKIKRHHFKNI